MMNMSLRQMQFVPGQPSQHHAHPSVGSLMFGGFTESTTSSPAPPLSATFPPPPAYHPQTFPVRPPQHHQPYPPHAMNNLAHMDSRAGSSPSSLPDGSVSGPPASEALATVRNRSSIFVQADAASYMPNAGGANPYRRPLHEPMATQDAPPPKAPEAEVNYSAFPNGIIPGIGEQQSERYPQSMRQGGYSGATHPRMHPLAMQQPPPPPSDTLDGLFTYLRGQFATSSYADCTLELRYADDHAHPVRIPGHALLFARSPTLRNIIDQQVRESGSPNSHKSLLLEVDDPYLRSDAFWLAVQRLYGAPLLDLGIFSNMGGPMPAEISAPVVDRFDLALGYVAAGSILGMQPVVSRGTDIAMQFLNWGTIEKALSFALQGGLDFTWSTSEASLHEAPGHSPYGPASNKIIHDCLRFLIGNYPADFELDTTLDIPARLRRLPITPDESAASARPRLSAIRFGELPAESTSVPAARAQDSVHAILSRILLELPFPLLQAVLHSPRLGNASRWGPDSSRHTAMHAIIAEREARRTRVLESVQVTHAAKLKNPRQWAAVNWVEAVVSPSSSPSPSPDVATETSVITRTWVDSSLASK